MAIQARQSKAQEHAPEELELMKAMDTGMGLRSKRGMRFARATDGLLSDKYTVSRQEKAEFRREWCQAQLANVQRARKRKQSFRTWM